ncbi:hypothetical protein ACLX1H_010020 [Fusarium chlamydosporum]
MPALPPSTTIPLGHHHFAVRQDDDSRTSFTAIPTVYKSADTSLHPGAVAGIVLGSVAAFLLLLYIIYMLLHRGPVEGPPTKEQIPQQGYLPIEEDTISYNGTIKGQKPQEGIDSHD